MSWIQMMTTAAVFGPLCLGLIGFSYNLLRVNVGKGLAFFYTGDLLAAGIAAIVLAMDWLGGGAMQG